MTFFQRAGVVAADSVAADTPVLAVHNGVERQRAAKQELVQPVGPQPPAEELAQ